MIVTSSMSVEYVRKMEVILMMIVTSSMSVEYVRKMKVILINDCKEEKKCFVNVLLTPNVKHVFTGLLFNRNEVLPKRGLSVYQYKEWPC